MTTESEQLPSETLPKHRQPYRYTGDAMMRSLVKEIGTKVKHNIIYAKKKVRFKVDTEVAHIRHG